MLSDYRNLDQNARKAIAAATQTPVEALEQFAKDEDPDVRRAVVSNPSTPTQILLKLGEEFPEEVIANPIFNLLLLENSYFVSLSLARSSTTPAEILIQLAKTADTEILWAIARNPNTPISVLEETWEQPFYSSLKSFVITRIAKHPETSLPILEKIIYSSNSTDGMLARWDIASHPNLSSSALEMLAEKLIEDYVIFEQIHQQLKDGIHPELKKAFQNICKHPNRTQEVLSLIENWFTTQSSNISV